MQMIRFKIRNFSPVLLCCAFMLLAGFSAVCADAQINVERHKPCNIFTPEQEISFDATIKTKESGKAKLTAIITGYNSKPVMKKEIEVNLEPNKPAPFKIDLGKLPNGYYEMRINSEKYATTVNKLHKTNVVSFGVAPNEYRTAKETRDGGYRFGLKMWYMGNAWWRGNYDFDEREATTATTNLGLNWTRAQMQQTAHLPTEDLMKKYDMNVIMKMECFPENLYDEQRYGPRAEYEKKNGGRVWSKKTLPKKAGYQKWLREELKKIPKDQKVFEICNEAWDKMPAEDLATFAQWIAEVILSERPDAIIGPNLKGITSKYEYDALFIDAGGMKNLKMVALHPYAGSEDRKWMRNYLQWLKEKTGRDISIYVTEYGSHSCPEGPSKRSEEEQSIRVVRQSLALYAEDVKAFTPHWLGQREENPTYHEHWFGYYRLNHEPKPVLLALATCARMIDSSRYVGDLWYGPELGAMLFEKGGKYTLALWKGEGEKEIEVAADGDVELVDIMGAAEILKPVNGKVKVKVGIDPVYLCNVSPSLEKVASKELREDRWPKPAKPPRNIRKMPKAKQPIEMDGKFEDWKGSLMLSMINAKVNGADASGLGYLSWDDDYLYIGLDMRDNQVMNDEARPKLYRQDSLELFVSTEPRETNVGYGPSDKQFFVTPTSAEGKPIVGEVVDRESGKVVDVKGAKYKIDLKKEGWFIELALPWSALGDFKAVKGSKLALEMRVNDKDKSHERWKIDPEDGNVVPHDPTAWSILELE